ncbi:hypothetical protein AJ80_06062 [Polytolypa hystricis UAMH7299]|uniref:SWR1-complex protein 3 domain-containing protein n=1 Tax=Polytolypa hystricis (strain UAMH7299) TaxID=1447883 RepID=A0A2B7XZS1_POLH7|nr:hypothetical protein AJ80_06062 [Polytolypa hystricis UAMH7299]
MVEKRRLPPRDRGEGAAAKRRISEAMAQSTPARKKAATPVTPAIVHTSPEPVEESLPTKIKDGQPLPTLPKPQTGSTLTLRQYQSYAESAVIAASLHRSRLRWLNNCPFEKFWTKPSKKKSQPQVIPQNPPRESMVKLGACTLVIEPHHFDVMLYTVRQPQPQTPVPPPQTQRPIVPYAPPNNFHQYQPPPPHPPSQPTQPPPSNQQGHLRPYSPSPHAAPPPQSSQQTRFGPQSHPNTPTPPPPHHAPPRQQPRPETPGTGPPTQKPPDPLSEPPKPSPDPVIQMLATRAATNPDLKALMRVVASSQASQEQLRTFQAHIDELNAILAARKQKEPQNNPPPMQHPSQGPPLAPVARAPSTSSPAPGGPPPAATGAHLPPPSARASPARPMYQPSPPPLAQPIRSKGPQHPPPPGSYFHQYPISQPPVQQHHQQPKPDPKAVVFEFLTPTPQGGVSHAGSGDRYLFPANTILDYFPGGTTVIASFLLIKKIDPSAPDIDLTGNPATAGGKARSKKSKAVSRPGTATPNETPARSPAPPEVKPDKSTPITKEGTENKSKISAAKPTTSGPESAPPSATKSTAIKEYYQPVTIRLHANNPRILEPLARVVKSQADVRQHMNDVMDRMDRADIEYLAFRLPRENPIAGDGDEDKEMLDVKKADAGRRRSKSKGDVTGVENGGPAPVAVKKEGNDMLGSGLVSEQENEVLKDFYDMPSGLAPLR